MAKVFFFADFENQDVLALEVFLKDRGVEVERTRDPWNVSGFCIVCFSGGFESQEFVSRLHTRQGVKLLPVVLTGGVLPKLLQDLFRIVLIDGFEIDHGDESSRFMSKDLELLICAIKKAGGGDR